MSDIKAKETVFFLDIPAKVAIRNDESREIFNFDVNVTSMTINTLSFTLIDRTFALVLSKYHDEKIHLSGLISFVYNDEPYTFELEILDYKTEFTPDRRFLLTMISQIIDHNEDLTVNEEEILINSYGYDYSEDENKNAISTFSDALDIMTSLSFNNMFSGFMNRRIDCELFESQILDMIDEEQKNVALRVYHKDYHHNQYRMFEGVSWQDRQKFLEIIRNLYKN